jgi:hypothetical protein
LIVIINHVWHFNGEASIPPQLRNTPFELSDSDLAALTLLYAVMLYRNDATEIVLALDTPRGRFRQR